MTRQQRHDLIRLEPRIRKPLNNSVHRVRRLRHCEVRSWLRGRGPTEEKVELRGARAVRGAHGGGEVDEVTCGEIGGLEDGELYGSDVVDSVAKGLWEFGVWVSKYMVLDRMFGQRFVCNLPDVGICRGGDVSERGRVEM